MNDEKRKMINELSEEIGSIEKEIYLYENEILKDTRSIHLASIYNGSTYRMKFKDAYPINGRDFTEMYVLKLKKILEEKTNLYESI